MITDLKPYPAYKDTGLPWLEKVPEHWQIRRGKVVFNSIDVRSRTGEEELLTVSSERGIVPRRSATVTMFKAESYKGYKLCWPGDLVINSLWAWARGLGVSQYHGIVSSAYGVYRLRPDFQSYSSFIHEFVRSVPFNWELRVRSKGIWISRLQLTDDAFLDAPFLFPAPEEESAIVRFLDHVALRIQRYIRAKKKLIALLKEQKQLIINHAVTRGLDPSVHLKPSGVEWLGNVPQHWEIWQVGHFARIGNGSTPSRGNMNYWQNGTYPWLNSSSVHRGVISSADQFVTHLALQECHLPRVQPNSILVAITGQGKTRGTTALLSVEATINQHLAYITPSPGTIVPEFLYLSLVGAYTQLRAISDNSGGTKGALTCADISHFRVPRPPIHEQEQIISAVRQATHNTMTAHTSIQREIELLFEYRMRLIADVVTGKLDVRQAAARLPDEPEEADEIEGTDAIDKAEVDAEELESISAETSNED